MKYFPPRGPLRDLIVVAGIGTVLFLLAAGYDLSERLYEISRRHESLELDELILALAISCLLAFFYLVLQWKRLSGELSSGRRSGNRPRNGKTRRRNLTETIDQIIFTLDEQGRITYVSPAVVHQTGYTRREVIGRPFTEFIHPEDRPSIAKRFPEAMAGKAGSSEYRICGRNGEIRWVYAMSRPKVQNGRRVGLDGVLTDITEQKGRGAEKSSIRPPGTDPHRSA